MHSSFSAILLRNTALQHGCSKNYPKKEEEMVKVEDDKEKKEKN